MKTLFAAVLFLVALSASALQSPKEEGIQRNAAMALYRPVTLTWDGTKTMMPFNYTLFYNTGSVSAGLGLEATFNAQVGVTYTCYVLARYPVGGARSKALLVKINRKGVISATPTMT